MGSSSIDFKAFLTSIGAQFGSYSPFLFLIAFYGFFKSFKTKMTGSAYRFYSGASSWLFFFIPPSMKPPAPLEQPFYLLFIPIGVYALSIDTGKAKKNFLNISIGFSLMVPFFSTSNWAENSFLSPTINLPSGIFTDMPRSPKKRIRF